MTPEQESRVSIHRVLVSADRQYATDHLTNMLPPDRMDVFIRAMETNVGATAVRELQAQLASTRGCVARMVEAITGEWRPDRPAGAQTVEAMRVLHRLEEYVKSLQVDQEVA